MKRCSIDSMTVRPSEVSLDILMMKSRQMNCLVQALAPASVFEGQPGKQRVLQQDGSVSSEGHLFGSRAGDDGNELRPILVLCDDIFITPVRSSEYTAFAVGTTGITYFIRVIVLPWLLVPSGHAQSLGVNIDSPYDDMSEARIPWD